MQYQYAVPVGVPVGIPVGVPVGTVSAGDCAVPVGGLCSLSGWSAKYSWVICTVSVNGL